MTDVVYLDFMALPTILSVASLLVRKSCCIRSILCCCCSVTGVSDVVYVKAGITLMGQKGVSS